MIRKKKLDVVRGGIAIPIPNKDNYYYMSGRKHINGGIDLGKDPKTGLEVEDGEVIKIGKNDVKVFSAVPFQNGKSPAERVLSGENAGTVFKEQETFKDRNGLNDDGTKKGNTNKAELGKKTGPIFNPFTKSWYREDVNNRTYLTTDKKYKKPFGYTMYSEDGFAVNYNNDGKEIDRRKGTQTPSITGNSRNIREQKYFDTDKEYTDSVNTISKRYGLNPNLVASRLAKENIDRAINRYNESGGKHLISNTFHDDDIAGPIWGLDDFHSNVQEGKTQLKEPWVSYEDVIFNNEKERVTNSAIFNSWSDIISATAAELKGRRDRLKKNYPNISEHELDAIASGSFNRGEVGIRNYIKEKGIKRVYDEYKPFINLKSNNTEIDGTKKKKLGGNVVGLYSITSNGETRLRPFPSTGSLPRIRRKAALGTVSDDDNDDWTYTPRPEYKRLYDKFNVKALNRKFDKDYFNLINKLKANENLTVADIYNGGENTEDAKLREILGANSTYKDIFDTDKENKLYDYYTTTYPEMNVIESRSQNNKTATNNTLKEVVITPKNDEYETDMSITNNKPFESTTLKEVVVTPKDIKDNTENRIAKNEKRNRLINSYLSGYHGDAINLLSNIGGNIATTLINKRALNKMQAPPQPISQTAAKLKTNYNINPQLDNLRETAARYEEAVNNNTASSRTALARNQQNRFATALNTNTLYGTKENEETKLINADKLNQQEVANKNVEAYNAWQDKVNAFKNAITEKKAENLVGLTQGITSGITSTIENVQQRMRDDKTILANALSRPNLPIEEFYHNGLISKRAYDAYRKAYPLKTDTNKKD